MILMANRPKLPAKLSTDQVIAQAKKNLRAPNPNAKLPLPQKGDAQAKVHNVSGGLVQQYKKRNGSAMW